MNHLPLWTHKHVYSYICTHHVQVLVNMIILLHDDCHHHVKVHDSDNKQIQTTAALKSNNHNLPSSHPVNFHKCDSAAKDCLYDCLCFKQICSYRYSVFTYV